MSLVTSRIESVILFHGRLQGNVCEEHVRMGNDVACSTYGLVWGNINFWHWVVGTVGNKCCLVLPMISALGLGLDYKRDAWPQGAIHCEEGHKKR